MAPPDRPPSSRPDPRDLTPIDPEARRLIDLIKSSGAPAFETLAPAAARAAFARGARLFAADPPAVRAVEDCACPGPGSVISLRIYRGANAGADAPALLFLHGGGWTVGDLDTHDSVCRILANAAACVTIAVAYRLAPEHKHPAAYEDCCAAARWAVAEAARLGIDPRRLAVGGDSAGGNLAAALALAARDGLAPPFLFQLLLYPAVDATMRHPSYAAVSPDAPLTRQTTEYFLAHYLADPRDASDWRVSPLAAARFDDLPPAFVLTVRHDPLRDEGRAYAAALERAGVRVWTLDLNDETHGFLTSGRAIRAAGMALEMAGAALRYAFATL